MSVRSDLRRSALPLLIVACLAAGCTSTTSVEGKYYNAMGVFTLELKGGKLIPPPGMEMLAASYTVHGDSILLTDPKGGSPAVALIVQKDGSIEGGMFGVLKKK